MDVLSFLWRKVRVAVKSDQLQNLTHSLKKNIQSEVGYERVILIEIVEQFRLIFFYYFLKNATFTFTRFFFVNVC